MARLEMKALTRQKLDSLIAARVATRYELDVLTARVALLEQQLARMALLATQTTARVTEAVEAVMKEQPVRHTFVRGEQP